MRYQLIEIDLASPVKAVPVPPAFSGLGIVARFDGRPVGFVLAGLPPGSTASAEWLAEMAAQVSPEVQRRKESGEGALRKPPLSLTVAVCTRNRREDLARCLAALESARRVAGIDARILVVDNAPSDDSTRELVASVPGVEYVREPKPGLDFARNTALRLTRTEYLAFVDDDALVDRGWMAGLANAAAEHPNAGAFTGPILPAELETDAQILFERRGGYNRRFQTIRFSRGDNRGWLFPFRGIAGSGCNMAFRRDVLVKLQGFDEALDTGRPLPGGGDLDIFHRVVHAGFELINAPDLTVFHRHRRTYAEFRHQMYTWDLGFMAYVMKTASADPAQRGKAMAVVLNWCVRKAAKLCLCVARMDRQALDLTLAEIRGGVTGIAGEYQRSLARVEEIRRAFASAEQRAI